MGKRSYEGKGREGREGKQSEGKSEGKGKGKGDRVLGEVWKKVVMKSVRYLDDFYFLLIFKMQILKNALLHPCVIILLYSYQEVKEVGPHYSFVYARFKIFVASKRYKSAGLRIN